ncbi:transporter substrate-binding domain-containing protein [Variovorax paradoxus]|nr:transporter substrate-binding domain-containing protein [Variovorax paradoxus]
MKFPMSRRRLVQIAASAALVASMPLAMHAAAQSIEDIKKRGTQRVGVLSELPPWGFVSDQGKNVGYDIDVAELIGKKLGVKVELVPMNVAARIAQLMTGKVDLLLATMGMYPDRAKVVQFSKPYAALSIIVAGKKSDNITKLEDLAGKKVGVTRAAAQDTAITQAAPKGATIQRFDDDAAVVQALLAGQSDVIGANTTYLMNIRKAMPDAPFEQKLVISRQYMGVAMRPGNKELNTRINQIIDEIKASGELNAISKKWINQDLPELVTELPGVPFTVQ